MKEKVNKEKLLQKYYEGETTLAEEKWLKEHILSENTSVEQLIFNDLHTLKQNFSDKSAAKKKNKKIKMVVLSSFAAAACLLLFFWKPFDRCHAQQRSHLLPDLRRRRTHCQSASITDTAGSFGCYLFNKINYGWERR